MRYLGFAVLLGLGSLNAQNSLPETPARQAVEPIKGKRHNPELRQAMQQFHQETVVPFIRAERQAFDTKLSPEDRALLAQKRQERQALQAKREMLRQAFRQAKANGQDLEGLKAQKQALREERQAFRASLEPLIQRYETELKGHRANIEGQKASWQAQREAILKQHLGEEGHLKFKEAQEHPQRHRKGYHGHKSHKGHHARMHKGEGQGLHRFLLMDVEAPKTKQALIQIPNLRYYPNPVVEQLNLELNLAQKADKVEATVINQTGQIVRQWQWQGQEAGTQRYQLHLRDLSAGVYILVLQVGDLRQTEQFIKQ